MLRNKVVVLILAGRPFKKGYKFYNVFTTAPKIAYNGENDGGMSPFQGFWW